MKRNKLLYMLSVQQDESCKLIGSLVGQVVLISWREGGQQEKKGRLISSRPSSVNLLPNEEEV